MPETRSRKLSRAREVLHPLDVQVQHRRGFGRRNQVVHRSYFFGSSASPIRCSAFSRCIRVWRSPVLPIAAWISAFSAASCPRTSDLASSDNGAGALGFAGAPGVGAAAGGGLTRSEERRVGKEC